MQEHSVYQQKEETEQQLSKLLFLLFALKLLFFATPIKENPIFSGLFFFCGILFRLTGGVSGGTEKAGE